MKILFCASEAVPFAKTGGLADVVGALPPYLHKCGEEVAVLLPYYKSIKEKNCATYIGYSFVDIAGRREYVGVFHAEHAGVDFYFVDNERYFLRDQLYGYGDDGERFAYFCFAFFEAVKVADLTPDIIHVNDWQTGLIPYLLRTNHRDEERFSRVKTVFSVHNLQYQGSFSMDMMSILAMPYSDRLEFDGRLNFMKTAIVTADFITTVSETYKEEVLTYEYGYGLQDVLAMRKEDFAGILNGIDTEKYDPATDKYVVNYTARNFVSGKRANKKALYERFGMRGDVRAPLFGLVSRFVDQKGLDLLLPVLEELILTTEADFVFVGSGEAYYENFFRLLAQRYPDRFGVYVGYSDERAQQVYAAADVFLMPSRFEPCGLGQMIAMRYGALPLVRETGGLKDTVSAYNRYTKEGNGFSFYGYGSESLKSVVRLACAVYGEETVDFRRMARRAMKQDFSWERSAKKYIEIYDKLLRR